MMRILQIIASAQRRATPERLRQTKAAIAILLFVLAPLFSFAEFRARILYFNNPGTTETAYTSVSGLADEQALYFAYYNNVFGLGRRNSASVETPSLSTSTYGALLNNQISFGDNYYTNSPAQFPRVYDLYIVACSLIDGGYSGPGVELVVSGSHKYYNVFFPDLVSDVLSSTNTVWRQLLLSHLSAINSALVNIDTGVSSLVPSVDRIADINSQIASNTFDSISFLRSIETNSLWSANSLDSLSSWLRDNPFNPFLSDFTNAVQALPEISSHYRDSDVSYLLDTYSGLSASEKKVFAMQLFYDVNTRSSAITGLQTISGMPLELRTIGDYLSVSVIDSLIGDYPENTKGGTRDSKAVSNRTSIKSQMNSWRDELKNQLQAWKDDLKQDLQAWKTSDEHGILNIKKTIEDNFMSDDPRIPGYSNTVPFTVYVSNTVTRPITNVVSDSARGISSNVVEQSRKTRDLLNDKLFDPNAPGINVRVVYPIYGEDIRAINVHDTALDSFGFALDGLNDTVQVFAGDVGDRWSEWFAKWSNWEYNWYSRWDSYAEISTNLFAAFNDSRPVADLASDFVNEGFDESKYNELPWFSRVEVLLAMLAAAGSNSVEVADIEEDMKTNEENFMMLSTNIVSVSSDVFGLFDYVKRFSNVLQGVFGVHSAPLTRDYVLLESGHWIGDEPLVLRVNPDLQNFIRLLCQCFWYLSALVIMWCVVSWAWSKVLAVLRWLWSLFDV